MKLPQPFEDKMKGLLKEEYPSYLACFEEPRHFGLRVNTNKISVEEFLKLAPWPLERVPWIHNGFYYDPALARPSLHPYYYAGLYYLQEPSAMTPANRLPIEQGDKVLDICAAPGGKATELGARLLGGGVLIANDISSSRAKGLLKNLELSGIGNMLVLSEEPGRLTEYFPGYFDKILIDAPCSGEGMFRKEPKMVRAWEEHGPLFFSKIQKSILTAAAAMLRPGGMLLYSTCTFDPLENEQAIEYLLTENPDFEILSMEPWEGFEKGLPKESLSGEQSLLRTVRIFPHKMRGEGHYLALLKKNLRKGSSPDSQNPEHTGRETFTGSGRTAEKDTKLPRELMEFWADIKWSIDTSRLDIRGERIYYMPLNLPDLRGIRFLRSGLLLGELKKNRFEPSQALAMFLKKEEYGKVIDLPLSDQRVMKYLKGDTLDLEDLVSPQDKGWYLVCVDGFPLGFGKLKGQVLKNKYLPGWRKMS